MQCSIAMASRYQPLVILARNQELNSLSLNAIGAGNHYSQILDQFFATGGEKMKKKDRTSIFKQLFGNLETTESEIYRTLMKF